MITNTDGYQVTLDGLPYKPIGMDVTFGINTIPFARVPLDASQSCFSNVDAQKNRPCVVSLRGSTGCVTFKGLFDGISISQNRGGFSYQAVIQGNFRKLKNCYPLVPGYSPYTSDSPYTWTYAWSKAGGPNSALTAFEMAYSDKVPVEGSAIQFFIRCFQAGLRAQLDGGTLASNSNYTYPIVLELIQNSAGYKQVISDCIALLDAVDCSAVSDMLLRANTSNTIAQNIYKQVLHAENMFDVLVNLANAFNCVCVFGVDKAWIVPANPYVRFTGDIPGIGGSGGKINAFAPSEIGGCTFDSVGYNDVGNCVVIGSVSPYGSGAATTNIRELGAATLNQPNAPALLITRAQAWASGLFMDIITKQSPDGRSKPPAKETPDLSDGAALRNPRFNFQTQGSAQFEEALSDPVTSIFNGMAQSALLAQHNATQTGSLNGIINTNVCPGTSGYYYTRYPGLFIYFFVSSVTHSIQISPSGGSAMTALSFSHGRVGGNDFVDDDIMFKYNAKKMMAVQQAFVSDIR